MSLCLKRIVWDTDDTAVAAQLAGSAGNIGAAKITADGEAKKTEASKLDSLAKERASKLADAKTALDEAQVNYDIALADVKLSEEALTRDPANATLKSDLQSAKKKVVEAEIRRNAAREKVEAIEGTQAFNQPISFSAKLQREANKGQDVKTALTSAIEEERKEFSKAWGPVWFEIQDAPNLNPPSLKLIEFRQGQ